MKMKLIVSLLVLCLSLSIVSVQAQTDTVGAMDNVNVFMTGDIAKTITCNVTGNAVIMDNMITENMTSENMTSENMTTFNVTGRMLLIRDIGNMTEKAVIIGKMDNAPGNVVIFGEREKITEGMEENETEEMEENETEEMEENETEEMEENETEGNETEGIDDVTEYMNNMTVLMTGNMTGTITVDMTKNMNNTGPITGNMTGTITGDMTRKLVGIRNMGPILEMVKMVCNTTWTADGTDYIPGPAVCDMTGKMVMFKTTEDMTVTERDIFEMVKMGGDRAILENMTNTTEMGESMGNTTGKLIIVQKMDDTLKIVTRPITFNTTESTTTINT